MQHQEEDKTQLALRGTRETWFRRIRTLLQQSQLDEHLWEKLEELLISADAGVTTTDNLLCRLRQNLKITRLKRPGEVLGRLKQEMIDILSIYTTDDMLMVKEAPLVILMVGVNGVGKTTSIAKLAQRHKEMGKSVLLGAADTFRPAGIEQLQAWAHRIHVDIVAHQAGSDPGAVAFDTLQAAKARNTDVVIIDTAGRLHTKVHLMEELKKIRRILSRQLGDQAPRVILTLDATIGQNGLVQARSFTQAVQCTGVFLAKLDGTSKGGIVLAIAEELKLPVIYIGTGEEASDVALFDPREFVEGLFPSDFNRDG